MNTSCPTCNKPVDPLRARNVKVRDGKVVAYCSAVCEQAGETKPTAIPRAQPFTLDSGPVIEIVRDPTGKVAEPDDDDEVDSSGNPKVGVNLAQMHELDRTRGRAPTPPPPVAPRPKAPLLLVLVLVVGGAGALLAYKYLFSNPDGSASSQGSGAGSTQPVAVPPPVAQPALPPPPGAAESVAKARAVLETNLDSQSPRVQRVAAAALSRTGDPKAITLLASALTKETSDIIKLDLAYALARAGDKRGRTALVAGLGSGRRDIKAAAGRSLALLGDDRAAQGLAPYLAVSQLRLGAAEALAYLADPSAVAVLDQLRGGPEAGDAKTSPDDRARATIALGFAGRTDVIPDLHKLLDDPRFNAFAAHALAKLRDPAAKPPLVEQLAIPSLRVDAARSLRVLEPTFDATPHLAALLAALGSLKDTEQVQVAEAILLLAGEASWSERP